MNKKIDGREKYPEELKIRFYCPLKNKNSIIVDNYYFYLISYTNEVRANESKVEEEKIDIARRIMKPTKAQIIYDAMKIALMEKSLLIQEKKDFYYLISKIDGLLKKIFYVSYNSVYYYFYNNTDDNTKKILIEEIKTLRDLSREICSRYRGLIYE